MVDYYLEDKSRLNGQPKRTIADYVEKNGILVPRRFDSITEAKKFLPPEKIFLRSEHEQEYDGISGLLNSYLLNSETPKFSSKNSINEIKLEYFHYLEKGEPSYKPWNSIKDFCKYFNYKEEKFKEETTFSIWEKILGINHIVSADSAIKGMYHIMSEGRLNEKKYITGYTLFENGKILKELTFEVPGEISSLFPKIVGIYEKIRNLNNFDAKHVPIMEFQNNIENIYFLQYHRGRDEDLSDFILSRKPDKNEFRVPFVRGKTKEVGEDFKITFYYGRDKQGNYKFETQGEEGSYDFHYNRIFSEDNLRRRKAQFDYLNSENDLAWGLRGYSCKHDLPSKIFKPEIFVIHNLKEVLKNEKEVEKFSQISKSGKNSFINYHLESDGKRAFIKRID